MSPRGRPGDVIPEGPPPRVEGVRRVRAAREAVPRRPRGEPSASGDQALGRIAATLEEAVARLAGPR